MINFLSAASLSKCLLQLLSSSIVTYELKDLESSVIHRGNLESQPITMRSYHSKCVNLLRTVKTIISSSKEALFKKR